MSEPRKTEPGKTDLLGDLRLALLNARQGVDALLALTPPAVALEALRAQSPSDAAGFEAMVEQVQTIHPQLKALATSLTQRLERLEGLASPQKGSRLPEPKPPE